jgi:hypothetical protein
MSEDEKSSIGVSGHTSDVSDYLSDGHLQFGLQEVSRVQAFGYFVPLLHEMFNGGEAKTRIMFSMLHGLMTDERVRWTRLEIDDKYHWLKTSHRNYLLLRMSNVGWLEYYRDQGMYMISDKGEALMRIMSRLIHGRELTENEGAALAEIEFSQLLDFPDITDRLKFLRNRLLKHIIRANTALESESPYLILEIYQQLNSAYRWAEQTRESLDNLDVDDADVEGWNTIRSVHDHLSKLHSQISRMQLILQDIQRKQIDIARYGVTHLDVDNYLINSRADALANMMGRHLFKIPHPLLVIESNMFLEAAEMLGRDVEQGKVYRGWETDTAECDTAGEPEVAEEAERFGKALKKVTRKWRPLETLVTEVDWEEAAYRFSLLTVMADQTALDAFGVVREHDPLITNPVAAEFDENGQMIDVDVKDEVWSMTKGHVKKYEPIEKEVLEDS